MLNQIKPRQNLRDDPNKMQKEGAVTRDLTSVQSTRHASNTIIADSPHKETETISPEASPDEIRQLNLKYRTSVFAEFAARGTFSMSSSNGEPVIRLDVPPNAKKAVEMRTAYWEEMKALMGERYYNEYVKDPWKKALSEDGLYGFGQFPQGFEFKFEQETNSITGAPFTAVEFKVTSLSTFGGGRMTMEQFHTNYGDVAKVAVASLAP